MFDQFACYPKFSSLKEFWFWISFQRDILEGGSADSRSHEITGTFQRKFDESADDVDRL